MVRGGSTVRVRQRASEKRRKSPLLPVSVLPFLQVAQVWSTFWISQILVRVRIRAIRGFFALEPRGLHDPAGASPGQPFGAVTRAMWAAARAAAMTTGVREGRCAVPQSLLTVMSVESRRAVRGC